MRELRERVAEELWKSTRAHVLSVFGVPGSPGKWEWEDKAGKKPFYAEAEAAMAVIAQDRAARLEARMPEIEAAIDETVSMFINHSRALSSVGLAHSPEAIQMTYERAYEAEQKARESRARLLALIREVAG